MTLPLLLQQRTSLLVVNQQTQPYIEFFNNIINHFYIQKGDLIKIKFNIKDPQIIFSDFPELSDLNILQIHDNYAIIKPPMLTNIPHSHRQKLITIRDQTSNLHQAFTLINKKQGESTSIYTLFSSGNHIGKARSFQFLAMKHYKTLLQKATYNDQETLICLVHVKNEIYGVEFLQNIFMGNQDDFQQFEHIDTQIFTKQTYSSEQSKPCHEVTRKPLQLTKIETQQNEFFDEFNWEENAKIDWFSRFQQAWKFSKPADLHDWVEPKDEETKLQKIQRELGKILQKEQEIQYQICDDFDESVVVEEQEGEEVCEEEEVSGKVVQSVDENEQKTSFLDVLMTELCQIQEETVVGSSVYYKQVKESQNVSRLSKEFDFIKFKALRLEKSQNSEINE